MHVVISRKQRILGVDGIEDLEDYSHCCEMQLFTDLLNKIKIVEADLEKAGILAYLRTDMDGRTIIS